MGILNWDTAIIKNCHKKRKAGKDNGISDKRIYNV